MMDVTKAIGHAINNRMIPGDNEKKIGWEWM
jgi:hypothetical protein